MKFQISDADFQRLFGDKQQQADLLEYAYRELADATEKFIKYHGMKSKEEILDHLAKTVYSKGARKTIIGYLAGAGFDCADVRFAERKCSAREKASATFGDFISYLKYGKCAKDLADFNASFNEAVNRFWDSLSPAIDISKDDFNIGDWVKYIPSPDESYTECVEAIAHDSDGKMYLCLSNGEYVKPCYCVKYKAQGKERRELIDKLNAVL